MLDERRSGHVAAAEILLRGLLHELPRAAAEGRLDHWRAAATAVVDVVAAAEPDGAPAGEAPIGEEPAGEAFRAAARTGVPPGCKAVTFYPSKDGHAQLRLLAVRAERTANDLMLEALDLLFGGHGLSRIARPEAKAPPAQAAAAE